MKTEVRIRIGRIVSDRPLDASREQFAEALSAELSTLLNGGRTNRPASVEAHVADAVLLSLNQSKTKGIAPGQRSQ